jgi:hypothetical protein
MYERYSKHDNAFNSENKTKQKFSQEVTILLLSIKKMIK